MTFGRTDLARAFDDMKENQDGLRFQRAAVQLVRRDWPEIIASEPGKDLGADARMPQNLAPDGVGKVLACSITPTYAKIRSDARKVVTHFPNVRVLIFATPVLRSNAESGFRFTLAVSSFRFRARLGFSIPSLFSGQRGISLLLATASLI